MAEGSYPWSDSFQTRLLSLVLKEPEQMVSLVEPEFFSNPVLVDICRVIKDTYRTVSKHNQLSRSTVVELLRPKAGQDDAWPVYKKTVKKIFHTKVEDKEVLTSQALEFAKQSKYQNALIDAEKYVSSFHYEKLHAKFEELRSFGKDPDVGISYWDGLTKHGIETRWTEERYGMIPTGLKKLSRLMGGGLACGELAIVLGGGKFGKTTFLANVAAGGMWAGKTVAVASGELSSLKFRKRLDALISKVRSSKLHRRRSKVLKILQGLHKVMKGQCHIKQFPTGKASTEDIEVWLDQLEAKDIHVDMLIVDYLFLFRPRDRQKDKRHAVGQTTVELRGIAVERDIPVWTASQGNRASLSKPVVGPQDFAEDISQFWTLDFLVSLCQTKQEAGYDPQRGRLLLAAARDQASGGIDKVEINRDKYLITEKDWEDDSKEDEVEPEDKSAEKEKRRHRSMMPDDRHHKRKKHARR